MVDFKVIGIFDEINPYPVLIGIVWAFEMNETINLKNWGMAFENNELRVIVSLDLTKGAQYTEPNHDYYEDENIEHIYKLTTWNEDWINPTVDQRISWEKDNSYQSDSNKELEN